MRKIISGITVILLVLSSVGCSRSEKVKEEEEYLFETPVISKVENRENGIMINWNKIDGVDHFRVFKKTGESDWEVVGDADTNKFLDESVILGENYTYTVRCMDAAQEKYLSNLPEEGTLVKYNLLSTPALASIKQVNKGIEIKWDAVDGADSYRIYRKKNDGNWANIADLKELTYVDENVENGVKYTYTIRCITSEMGVTVVESDYVHEGISIMYIYLDTPVLKEVKKGDGGIVLEWDTVEGANQYRVFKKIDGGKWTKVADVKGTVCLDADVEEGVTYRYTVRCIDSEGKSYQSGFDKNGLTITY